MQQAIGVAAIGSMTATIKAQRALAAAGIAVSVVALSPGETKRGCAYGVSYAPAEEAAVRQQLRLAGIRASAYLRKGGEPL